MKYLQKFAKEYNTIGLITSSWFFFDSLRPSLLPRGMIAQGFISAVWVLVGYGLGCIAEWLISRKINFNPSSKSRVIVVISIVILGVGSTFVASSWQAEQIKSLGLTDQPYNTLLVCLVTTFWLIILMFLIRSVKKLINYITKHLDKLLPRIMAFSGAVIIFVAIVYVALSYGVLRLSQNLEKGQRIFDERVMRPDSSFRSGSPDSLISWDGLGKKGREFVAEDDRNLVVEPIRIYAGIDNEASLEERVQLVGDELIRTQALSRQAIVLFIPSGTGWVNLSAVEPVENIFQGDIASVSVQYSAVSSFLQFIVDQDVASRAGTLLFEKVRVLIDTLPINSRPKLYLYGESLGSLGSQDRFVGVKSAEFTDYFSGALWVGSPSASRLWSELRAEPSGTDGVLFSGNDDIYNKDDIKTTIFVYNSTDPVVWINRSLLITKPRWLGESRPESISQYMAWRPGLTFLQLAMELLKSSSQPSGIGHSYHDRITPAWQEIIGL